MVTGMYLHSHGNTPGHDLLRLVVYVVAVCLRALIIYDCLISLFHDLLV